MSITANPTAVRRTMLVKVDTNANNNKFYELSLMPDGSVHCRYGRVGADGVVQVYSGGAAKFESQMAAKKRKGYAEVDLIDAPAGMTSGGGKAVANASLASAAKKGLLKDAKDSALGKLIDNWAAANRHQIEMASGGMMTVSASGAVSTPVGIVSAASIAEARSILPQIQQRADRRLIERYLTLVPQDFGRTRGWESRFDSDAEITRQAAFLDQLDGSVAMAASMAKADQGGDEPEAMFRYKLVRVTDPEKVANAKSRFERTRNGMHTSSSLRLVNLYAVIDSEPHVGAWNAAAEKLGNVRRLWHGTGTPNLLSMLHRGFVVPPSNRGGSIHVTGRMFGDGAYFSDQSTKSLNYSQGYWNGTRSNHCFMFLCDVVMGTEHRPTTYGDAVSAAKRAGCHSVFAKGGTASVRNNEMIVWDLDQVRISYLCEFDS